MVDDVLFFYLYTSILKRRSTDVGANKAERRIYFFK